MTYDIPTTPALERLADEALSSRTLPLGHELFAERSVTTQLTTRDDELTTRRTERLGLAVRTLEGGMVRSAATGDATIAGLRRAAALAAQLDPEGKAFHSPPLREIVHARGGSGPDVDESAQKPAAETYADEAAALDDAGSGLQRQHTLLRRAFGGAYELQLRLRQEERGIVLVTFEGERRVVGESAARLAITLRSRGRAGSEAVELLARFGREVGHDPLRDDELLLEAAERARLSLERLPRAERLSSLPAALYFPPHRFGRVIHELIGHRLEADFALQSGLVAPAADRLASGKARGRRVAPDWCTLLDDGARRHGPTGRYGDPVDDEGTPLRPTPLVRRGELANILCDRRHGQLLGRPSTGSGRRATFRDPPLPRMSALVLEPGDADELALQQRIDDTLIVERVDWGRIDTASGTVRLGISGAHRPGEPAGARYLPFVLASSADALLASVVGLGRQCLDEPGLGRCRKRGQLLPSTWATPGVLVELRVGTAEIRHVEEGGRR